MPGANGASERVLADPAPARQSRWRDLGVRAASAAVLLPVAVFCLWEGDWIWAVMALLAGVLMLREFVTMAGRWPRDRAVLVGLAWVSPAVAAVVWLRLHAPDGMGDVLFLLCVVWSSDIGAYMVGRLVGGPKLAPAISPGKTISGAVGGLAAAMLVGAIAARIDNGDPTASIVIAAFLGVVSQAGDLLESAVKRHFGVKDSGNLIPGHGGLLDRLDAVLTVAPAAALLVAIRGTELWR